MLGAILGDIIGSCYEQKNFNPETALKSKDFALFSDFSKATDDSIMTMAIANAVWESKNDFSALGKNAIKAMQEFGQKIKYANYGATKEEIKDYVQKNYYSLDFTIDEIRPDYLWNVTCQGSLPQAIECFLESDSFVDCIRLAVSLGGDSDTQAAMAGAIAEAYYGLPDDAHKIAVHYCLPEMFCYVQALEYVYNGYKGELLKESEKVLEGEIV